MGCLVSWRSWRSGPKLYIFLHKQTQSAPKSGKPETLQQRFMWWCVWYFRSHQMNLTVNNPSDSLTAPSLCRRSKPESFMFVIEPPALRAQQYPCQLSTEILKLFCSLLSPERRQKNVKTLETPSNHLLI